MGSEGLVSTPYPVSRFTGSGDQVDLVKETEKDIVTEDLELRTSAKRLTQMMGEILHDASTRISSASPHSPSESIGRPHSPTESIDQSPEVTKGFEQPPEVTGSPPCRSGSAQKVPEAQEVMETAEKTGKKDMDVTAINMTSGHPIEVLEPGHHDKWFGVGVPRIYGRSQTWRELTDK